MGWVETASLLLSALSHTTPLHTAQLHTVLLSFTLSPPNL